MRNNETKKDPNIRISPPNMGPTLRLCNWRTDIPNQHNKIKMDKENINETRHRQMNSKIKQKTKPNK